MEKKRKIMGLGRYWGKEKLEACKGSIDWGWWIRIWERKREKKR